MEMLKYFSLDVATTRIAFFKPRAGKFCVWHLSNIPQTLELLLEAKGQGLGQE